MPTNKNQHFVPQHYLRMFSADSGKNIAIARLAPFKFVIGAISGQCQEDWFYREDGELDDWLRETETAYGELLPKILAAKKLSDTQRVACHFMAVLFCIRTKKAAEIHGLFSRRVFFDVANEGIKQGKIPPPPSNWSMDTVGVKGVSGFLVKKALFQCFLEMTTLQCKLLEPQATAKFITSDHPAICMNQLLADEGESTGRSYTGFSRSGFQLVLPIGPRLCLFFFDPKVYKVGGRRGTLVTLSDNDVELVNSLQIQNADKCVYSCEPASGKVMETLVNKFQHLRKSATDSLQTSQFDDEPRLYFLKSPNPLLLTPWTFCKLRRNVSVHESRTRNPAWTEIVSAFTAHVDKTKPVDLMNEFTQFVSRSGVR